MISRRGGENSSPPCRKKERTTMKSTFTRLFTLALAALTVLTASVMAASVGSSDDPLVTLSYLNEKFLPQVMQSVDEKIAARNETVAKELSAQIRSDAAEFEKKYAASDAPSGTVDSFAVVTMAKGQTLYGDIGCEVMLRVGGAQCVASSSPGLVNETSGTVIVGGNALEKNNLYMMTVTERGVRATADGTKVLVRGTYSVQ